MTQAYVEVGADGDIAWQGGTNENGDYNNSDYVGLGNIAFRGGSVAGAPWQAPCARRSTARWRSSRRSSADLDPTAPSCFTR